MAKDFADRFPPSSTAAKLYEKTSAKGNSYMMGRSQRHARSDYQDAGYLRGRYRDLGAQIFSGARIEQPEADVCSSGPNSVNQSATGGFGSQGADDQIPL